MKKIPFARLSPLMPELPEVETVARSLIDLVLGQKLIAARILDRERLSISQKRLLGRRISDVFRLGKSLLFELNRADGAPLWLGVHLRMTGRILWCPKNDAVDLSHVRAVFQLEKGQLAFQDIRRFGTLRIYDDLASAKPSGLDPTSSAFSAGALIFLLTKGSKTQEIKPWLIRQDRLSGLGNIYASEILHWAEVAPSREIGSLKSEEIRRLYQAICDVLSAAISACGTTFSDFQNALGTVGSYQRYLRVYKREGEPCPKCGAAIVRIVQKQRSTFFCQRCQR